MQHKFLVPFLILVSLLTINPRINGWNEASRMALTQSIVEHHELTIEQSTFQDTGDKLFINGKFYSDKPTTPSFLAAFVYLPLYQLGLDLSYGWNLAYYLIIFFIIKVLWILSVLAFYMIQTLFGVQGQTRLNYTLIYALASQAFTWSSTFNNHSIAASALILGFALYLMGRHDGGPGNYLLAGFFFGLSAAVDIPTGLFFLGFAFLVLRSPATGTDKWGFIAAGLFPLTFHFIINYHIGGTFLPLQFVREYLYFEGSQWTDGMRTNSPLAFFKYMFLSMLGPQGFLWYSPILVFLIPILVKQSRKGRPFHQETRVIAIAALLLMMTYFLLTQNYGGWGYGIRWFVPLVPLLYVYLFDIDSLLFSNWQKRLFGGLVIYSFVVAVIGLINPWSNPEYHVIPIVANLLQLQQFLF